jgi:hypothetical protein
MNNPWFDNLYPCTPSADRIAGFALQVADPTCTIGTCTIRGNAVVLATCTGRELRTWSAHDLRKTPEFPQRYRICANATPSAGYPPSGGIIIRSLDHRRKQKLEIGLAPGAKIGFRNVPHGESIVVFPVAGIISVEPYVEPPTLSWG